MEEERNIRTSFIEKSFDFTLT